MYDPTALLRTLTEYFNGVMLVVLTFYCWRLDRHGRVNEKTKALYVALVCLLLLIMVLPLKGF